MNLWETFQVAITALVTNRLRALLTILGIMIGVAAVVSLMSLGDSLQNYITDQFTSLGADTLQISEARNRNTASGTQPLTTADAEGIQNSVSTGLIAGITWAYSLQAAVSAGDNSVSVSVTGVLPNYADVNNWNPELGQFISRKQVDEAARVVLLDQTTAADLFGTANPIGQTVLIKGQVFTVTGVMETRAVSAFSQQSVLVPITTAQSRLANARVAGQGYRVSSIQLKVASPETAVINAANDAVEAYLLSAHGITDPSAADFSIFSAASILDSLSSTLSLLTIFLSAIAGISLLVGGIGVMNIMLVSVTERTREIGLRKAVGAQEGTILQQFLLESVLLSLLGGVIGILLAGTLLVATGALVPQFSIAVAPQSILLATGISTLIGIFAGLYPARRAAIMNPIDALRFE